MFQGKNGYPLGMVRIGFSSEDEKREYSEHKIDYNKRISHVMASAARDAKQDCCALCGKPCKSFCNSHSVPKFALRNIAENGEVVSPLQREVPALGDSFGVNRAGTFRLICESCDNTVFQQYEDPEAYCKEPTDQMLAQIAVKDQLQMISKRNGERALFSILREEYPSYKDLTEEKISITDYDLKDFREELEYAKKALIKRTGRAYYLCYFKVLDYTVPYAAQASVAMISDLEDQVINNIYHLTKNYKVKSIYIAVFPLKGKSVVLMFIENNDPRYRAFYRQLKKLSDEEQLATINYIIFSYSENVFLNPRTFEKLKNNQNFMDTCRKSTEFVTILPLLDLDPLVAAIEDFSLSQRNEIPNLLGEEFALEEML